LFVSEACSKHGLDKDELFAKSGQRAKDVEDTFSQISLFGENRQKIFKDNFSAHYDRGGKFFTKREKEFLMLCGRTPAKNRINTSKKRIVVRQIIFPSMKRINPMRTNSLGLLYLFKNCNAFFKHASAQDNLIVLFKAWSSSKNHF
jgi:hypothetical protein